MILGQAAEFGRLERWFVGFVDAAASGPVFVVGAVLAAVGIGALHALAPGHGKAITAAYLVGARGRARDAVALGAVVAFMHTASVLVLGILLFGVTRTPTAGAAAVPWMTLAAGMLVLLVGVGLVLRHLRRERTSSHGHRHHHEHTHAAPDVAPLSRRGLVLLGASGGLLPSPSAFLVLATGLFTNRVAFALALVAAFSVGLALTLIGIGLLVLRGRDLALRRVAARPRLARVARLAPLGGAVVVTLGGAWLTVSSLLRVLTA